MKIKVYTPSTFCPSCFLTKKQLKVWEEVQNADKDEDFMAECRSKGYSSFPIVEVTENDTVTDIWFGYSKEKIEEYNKKILELNSVCQAI